MKRRLLKTLGVCRSCGKMNEYQDGPYDCYECRGDPKASPGTQPSNGDRVTPLMPYCPDDSVLPDYIDHEAERKEVENVARR